MTISSDLEVVFLLSGLFIVMFAVVFILFYPVWKANKNHELRMNQLESQLKEWKDRKPAEPEYMDALEVEFHRQFRRNSKNKKRK